MLLVHHELIFSSVMLEPHIRDFHLRPLFVGSLFVIEGGFYAAFIPLWGYICHRKSPKAVASVGSLFLVAGLSIIGPALFIPLTKRIQLILGSLVLQG